MTSPVHLGPIVSDTGGRTDVHRIPVAANSYIIPADVVSAVPGAEGNTNAGHRILDEMFGSYSGGEFAHGGAVHKPVEIIAAGGEYVVGPDIVASLGGGDIKRGHEILDAFVKNVRAQNVKTLKKLPGPAKK